MSRLVIEIPDKQHRKIKALAMLRGTTIKDLILEKVLKEINDGRDLAMHQTLEAIFATRMISKKHRYPRKQMYRVMKKVIDENKVEKIYEQLRNNQSRS